MDQRYRVWGASHEAIFKPLSEAQNSFFLLAHWRRYWTIFRRSN